MVKPRTLIVVTKTTLVHGTAACKLLKYALYSDNAGLLIDGRGRASPLRRPGDEASS
jgi:hypothetical protein